MPECVNLRERFAQRFKIEFDPAYDPANRHRDNLDPWAMLLPLRGGCIFPYGGGMLAVEVDGRPILKRKLAGLACTTIIQDGDGGFGSFAFAVEDFEAVADLVKPRRRRRMTERQRAAAASRLRPFRFRTSGSGIEAPIAA